MGDWSVDKFKEVCARMGLQVENAGGQCPVQVEGLVEPLGQGEPTKRFYFRARGAQWSFAVDPADPIGDPEFETRGHYGVWPDAGYMGWPEVAGFMAESMGRYRACVPGADPPNHWRAAVRRALIDAGVDQIKATLGLNTPTQALAALREAWRAQERKEAADAPG